MNLHCTQVLEKSERVKNHGRRRGEIKVGGEGEQLKVPRETSPDITGSTSAWVQQGLVSQRWTRGQGREDRKKKYRRGGRRAEEKAGKERPRDETGLEREI